MCKKWTWITTLYKCLYNSCWKKLALVLEDLITNIIVKSIYLNRIHHVSTAAIQRDARGEHAKGLRHAVTAPRTKYWHQEGDRREPGPPR